MPTIFQPLIGKKFNKAPSVEVKVIYCEHRLLWWGSYKGDDTALTSNERLRLEKIKNSLEPSKDTFLNQQKNHKTRDGP